MGSVHVTMRVKINIAHAVTTEKRMNVIVTYMLK